MIASILIGAFGTPVIGNLWSLTTGRGFFIPKESSIFTFNVTKENDGSGEWWLYGEDNNNFYALHEKDPVYLVFSRADIGKCKGFHAKKQDTWCKDMIHHVNYE